MTTGWFVC